MRFEPQLLLLLSDYLAIHPEWRLVYTDEDALDENGDRQAPLFKPDFNLELLRSADYIGSLFVERNALLEAGGYSRIAGAECFDTALRIADAQGDAALGHIPDVLIHTPPAVCPRASEDGAAQALREHLARRGIAGDVFQGLAEGLTRRVLYHYSGTAKVSIIVPTRNRLELLAACVESLLRQTRYAAWELLLVDNGSDDPAVLAYYDTLRAQHAERIRLLRFAGPFNFSAMNNLAARHADGDYLLLLNNDTECIHDDWLDAMMSHAQRPDVGIVGARLLFPDSLKIQHAGLVLGMNGTAGRVFAGLRHTDPGYLQRALADQEHGAVTGACLLIRKSLFVEVGGLDEDVFRASFNDVDLCLKVRQRGYRVIWTPFATLLHHGSATLAEDMRNPAKIASLQKECDEFYLRWNRQLIDDPAWNRNLGFIDATPTVEGELAVPWRREFHDRPRIVAMPLAAGGVFEYRCMIPLRALRAAGKVQYAEVCRPRADYERAPTPAELARMAPDTLFMHVPVDNTRCQALLGYPRFNPDVFRVYSLDDLITNIPPGNPTYANLAADVMRERLALGLKASHRLIATTEPLAEACRGLIDDIRLVPNSLPWSVWGELRSRRRRGPRLRVGWAGAQQHAGDLRFLLDVVAATRNEVDWVFMGMMPEGIDPGRVEFHDYVHDFSAYPAKLASLDLDLAIAPLEMHPFNEAKSNLRLLEYGILGWPVICTDIFPYRTDKPPVTRLPNEAAQWIAAIRERVADPDALSREGDALRAWVKRHHLLENRLDLWLRALLP
jgi:GT2 family glycosyltransferase